MTLYCAFTDRGFCAAVRRALIVTLAAANLAETDMFMADIVRGTAKGRRGVRATTRAMGF